MAVVKRFEQSRDFILVYICFSSEKRRLISKTPRIVHSAQCLIWLREPIHIKLVFKGKITVKSGNPPLEPVKEPKPYQNPFELALLYQKMMKEQSLNQSQVAEKLGVSRVRITQYMNLLKLDPLVIKQVTQNNKQVTERQLRILAVAEGRTKV